LDFESLLAIMCLSRQFRKDLCGNKLRHKFEKCESIFKKRMKTILVKGLPTLGRVKFWNYRTKFYLGKQKMPELFQALKMQTHNEYIGDIKKDIYRTFPQYIYFQKPSPGQEMLFNVLNALAQYNTQTGYIQGMNFLAGIILLHLNKDEETFHMMNSILSDYKFN